jgi:rubrerythrin
MMLGLTGAVQRSFSELSDREVLALAIQSEEEDGRVDRELAEGLRPTYPASAAIFDGMAEEENEHRRRLLDLFGERFGAVIPLIRREDVRGFIRRKPVWMSNGFDIDTVRQRAETMEAETQRFYLEAASRTQDPSSPASSCWRRARSSSPCGRRTSSRAAARCRCAMRARGGPACGSGFTAA